MKNRFLIACSLIALSFVCTNFPIKNLHAEDSESIPQEVEELLNIQTLAGKSDNCTDPNFPDQCPNAIRTGQKFYCCAKGEECKQTPRQRNQPRFYYCAKECDNCKAAKPKCCGKNEHCIFNNETCCVDTNGNFGSKCPYGSLCCGIGVKDKPDCYVPDKDDCCDGKKLCKNKKCCDDATEADGKACIPPTAQCCSKEAGESGSSSCKDGDKCCRGDNEVWCCKENKDCGTADSKCKTTTTTTTRPTTTTQPTTTTTTTRPTTTTTRSTTTTTRSTTTTTTTRSTTTTMPPAPDGGL